MGLLKPYSTLLVGVALGMFVVPKALAMANINVPGR